MGACSSQPNGQLTNDQNRGNQTLRRRPKRKGPPPRPRTPFERALSLIFPYGEFGPITIRTLRSIDEAIQSHEKSINDRDNPEYYYDPNVYILNGLIRIHLEGEAYPYLVYAERVRGASHPLLSCYIGMCLGKGDGVNKNVDMAWMYINDAIAGKYI